MLFSVLWLRTSRPPCFTSSGPASSAHRPRSTRTGRVLTLSPLRRKALDIPAIRKFLTTIMVSSFSDLELITYELGLSAFSSQAFDFHIFYAGAAQAEHARKLHERIRREFPDFACTNSGRYVRNPLASIPAGLERTTHIHSQCRNLLARTPSLCVCRPSMFHNDFPLSP